MRYRWILQAPGRPLRRGATVPTDDMPGGGETLHLVSTEGSMALHDGVLLVDGQIALPGEYRAALEDGVLILVAGDGGVILERRREEATVDARSGRDQGA